MDFSDEIKKIKPKISVASLKTYNSLLKNVHRTAFGDDKPNIENFKKEKPIMEYLNKKPYNTRKTFMAALLCIEPDNKALTGYLHFQVPPTNDHIVNQDRFDSEGERIDNDGKFLRPDPAKILDDQIVHPGMLIVIDSPIRAWSPGEGVIVFKTVW